MLSQPGKQATIFFLVAALITGCGRSQSATPLSASVTKVRSISPTAAVQQPSPVFDISKYAFPGSVDTTKQYLFYFHGRIIEEQGIHAVSLEYGEYEYQEILEKLSSYGFFVVSEQRTKNTDSLEYAKRASEQITVLLNHGVPAGNITIVGASKGAHIAVYVSNLLKNQEINFVIMGVCHPDSVKGFKQNKIFLYGNVLSIYDIADNEFAGSCKELFLFSEDNGGLSRHDEIVLHVGTGHGILYKPLDEWIVPTVEWAGKQ